MKRIFLFLLLLLFACSSVSAYELVLPAEKNGIVNTEYLFFVGRAKKTEVISINDERIHIAPNGAFAHSVKLKDGENRIKVKSNYGRKFFKYYKNTPVLKEFPIEEFSAQNAIVKADNTPLRSTPVDAGLNRIAHLFEGTSIIINGVKGDFYRVVLSKDKEGWIVKKDVQIRTCDKMIPAEFISVNNTQYKNASIQTIAFDKRIPYTVEDNKKEIIFRVYNPELSLDSVYNLTIPKPEKYSYSITMEDGEYTFKVKEIPNNPKDVTVVIDAGHGGSEKGAIGCLGDEEKNINLEIAKELKKQLCEIGINAIMTRDFDCNISLNDRVNIAKENGADIFISIHLNSIGDIPMNIHKTRGTSVFYFNDNSINLAKSVLKAVTHFAKTRNDGVHGASFAVIRPTDYIAILVEAAYMTNPLDSVLYKNPDFAKNIAKGITNGLLDYLKK